MENHIGSVHEGKEPFKCTDCGAAFTLNGGLNRHIESVHEGKKPFKCNDCSAAFSRKGHLNELEHIESVHVGKKPFKCNYCGAAFTRKGGILNQYIKERSHSNVTIVVQLFPEKDI